ncbi:hypothetical protein E2C01_063767 [Portunus trituberculatus]|uniref:Uncharacterized protein n=1 Tax=Portunus trituberculatus TaxID=210409 RepID=A0A5B7HIJ4_PORTR|nr:hypothetical protein [Portunus trituberculatus]
MDGRGGVVKQVEVPEVPKGAGGNLGSARQLGKQSALVPLAAASCGSAGKLAAPSVTASATTTTTTTTGIRYPVPVSLPGPRIASTLTMRPS